MVYVANNYTLEDNFSSFISLVNNWLYEDGNSLFNKEPFASRQSDVNIYYINETSYCKKSTGSLFSGASSCNYSKIEQFVSNCPFDIIYVINYNAMGVGGSTEYSDRIPHVFVPNGTGIRAFLHESEHAFGQMDMYNYSIICRKCKFRL